MLRSVLYVIDFTYALDFGEAVNLGGQVHDFFLRNKAPQLCGVYDGSGANACNAKKWENMWTPALRSYNGEGASADTYARTIFGVAIHEFDPDFIAGCFKPANCSK